MDACEDCRSGPQGPRLGSQPISGPIVGQVGDLGLRSIFALLLLVGACARGGATIPDTSARVAAVNSEEMLKPDDVFLRDPWELWKTPHGNARYHRGTFMLLPNQAESFQVGEISVYAKDGSDVRLDYHSVDFGVGSQSLGSITVFVSRSASDANQEWALIIDQLRRQHPNAQPAEPFPIPEHYPAETKQAAVLINGADRFVQVSAFRRAGWTVRYQIDCPAQDIAVATKRALAFLQTIRYRE